MAAHLVIIACLVVEPHTCSEIPVSETILEDVVSCAGKAREMSEQWQTEHKDKYLVIASKCAKDGEGSGTPPPSGQSN